MNHVTVDQTQSIGDSLVKLNDIVSHNQMKRDI